jgi:hypothetical protein
MAERYVCGVSLSEEQYFCCIVLSVGERYYYCIPSFPFISVPLLSCVVQVFTMNELVTVECFFQAEIDQ